MILNKVNYSKRWFLKLSALFSVMLVSNVAIKKTNASLFIDDDIVVLNGWVMLRSDLN